MRKKVQNIPPFDDFLSLSKQDFNNTRLLIFHGISGSGKSSNLNYTAHYHSSFQNQSVKWIWTHHKRFKLGLFRTTIWWSWMKLYPHFNYQLLPSFSVQIRKLPSHHTLIQLGLKFFALSHRLFLSVLMLHLKKFAVILIRKTFHILPSLFCLFANPMGPIMSTFNVF